MWHKIIHCTGLTYVCTLHCKVEIKICDKNSVHLRYCQQDSRIKTKTLFSVRVKHNIVQAQELVTKRQAQTCAQFQKQLHIMSSIGPIGRAVKSISLKNFATFSKTIKSYDRKFYILVTHAIIRKCGKYHYIIYRIDKITLLLVMATQQLRRYPNYLNCSRQRKRCKCEHFFEYR